MNDWKLGNYDEPGCDRRSVTLYRPVLIETDKIAGFCLLRNISAEGMMGRFHPKFAPNTAVTVQFNPCLSASGRVSWSGDGMIGIRFAPAIDVPSILLGLATSPVKGKVNRAPRLQMKANIQIVLDGRTFPIEVQDISQKGLKVRSAFLRSGDEIWVLLDGQAPKKAVVRWTQPQLAGLSFVQPLAFNQLGDWVVRQQDNAMLRSA